MLSEVGKWGWRKKGLGEAGGPAGKNLLDPEDADLLWGILSRSDNKQPPIYGGAQHPKPSGEGGEGYSLCANRSYYKAVKHPQRMGRGDMVPPFTSESVARG